MVGVSENDSIAEVRAFMAAHKGCSLSVRHRGSHSGASRTQTG